MTIRDGITNLTDRLKQADLPRGEKKDILQSARRRINNILDERKDGEGDGGGARIAAARRRAAAGATERPERPHRDRVEDRPHGDKPEVRPTRPERDPSRPLITKA